MFGSQSFATQGVTLGDRGVASPPAKKQRPEENFTCLPVTLRQMEAALAKRAGSGEELTFFGVEPKELIVVAAVESIARQGTSLEMTINDGTGRLKARYFVTDAQPDDSDRIVPGRYISAFGGLRAAPAVHFAINGLRLVESVDEVSYHVIEVAHAALRLQVGAKEAAKSEVAGTFQSPQKSAALATEGALSCRHPHRGFRGASAGCKRLRGHPERSSTGAELKSAVLGLIRQTEGEAGVALQDMAAKFSSVESDVGQRLLSLSTVGTSSRRLIRTILHFWGEH
uniref:Single-stranded DNA-binding replication protein A n=1 Tax=Pfiesteria piscicida TaxID=71001 RepID=A3E3I8_PFIPI|nr:single-stranded DNA-binding replication protein A [Pfiesteria piscicida]